MGKPRLPILARLHREATEDCKRYAKQLPANRIAMRDLLVEAADRIEALEEENRDLQARVAVRGAQVLVAERELAAR